jgi:hypothetical protein
MTTQTQDRTAKRTRFIVRGSAYRAGSVVGRFGADLEMWVDEPYAHMISFSVERGSRMPIEEFTRRVDEVLAAPCATWPLTLNDERRLVCLIEDAIPEPEAFPDSAGPGVDPVVAIETLHFDDAVTEFLSMEENAGLRLAGIMLKAAIVGVIDSSCSTRVEVAEGPVMIASVSMVSPDRLERTIRIVCDAAGNMNDGDSWERLDVAAARDAVQEFVRR